jgi:cation transport ATPase
VREAQSGQAPVQRLADRVSAVFVPVVLALAVLTTLAWLVLRLAGRGLHRRASPSSSSPARARWGWPLRPRCSSAPGRARSSAS